MSQEPQTPQPVKLPEAPQHPSEPAAVSYHDPGAPKPKRKLHIGKVMLLLLVCILLVGGGLAIYQWQRSRNQEPSVISDYSGGLAESESPQSVETAETQTAVQFIKAVQAQDTAVVDRLASDTLRQQVRLEKKDETASVLSGFVGRFDGIDVDQLVKSAADHTDESGSAATLVTLSDRSSTEGSTGTYAIKVLIVKEAGTLKVSSVESLLNF